MDRDKLKDGIRLAIARVLDFKTDQTELECLADHLIANGIGDITAEKHRADVTEKALDEAYAEIKELQNFKTDVSVILGTTREPMLEALRMLKHRADVAEKKIAELTEENEKLSAELETAIQTRIVLFDKMKKYMDNSPIWEADNIIKLIETEERNYYNRYFYIKIMDNANLSWEDHQKVRNKIMEHFGERKDAI